MAPFKISIPACLLGESLFAVNRDAPTRWKLQQARFNAGIFNWEINLKLYPPKNTHLSILLALSIGASLCACSHQEKESLPVLSDPVAGITLTLPPTATSFTRVSAAHDRFVSRLPYEPNQTLLYLHAYAPPVLSTNEPPAFFEDVVECILRDEVGSFITLESSFTNLPGQTPVLLLYGRANDPDNVVGFAFQCNKTHFVFIGLSGPNISPDQASTFFQSTAAQLQIADIRQSTFADVAQFQTHLLGSPSPTEALTFVRNIFAARNASPQNYTTAINLAFILAQNLSQADPNSPHLSEALALLNNMSSIRLADFIQARHEFEVAVGQRNATEALAQAKFLSQLTFPFDAEGHSLDNQRIRKAHTLK